ncbi:MAG TPA: N-acetylglucosamine-6-phosphate deacetylase [Nocardioidaceae bacterium]|nr:N-acetylglucosamine-6-phosphate deacetylase [Nocardioidaceae bacterium]
MTGHLLRGRVVTPDGVLDDAVLVVEGDRISSVTPTERLRGELAGRDLPDPVGILLPGLVDVHCHGGGGAAFTLGDEAQVAAAAAHHLAQGTTSVVASAVTDSPERMLATVRAAAAAATRGEVAAIHLEGPFLSTARCGAQDPRHLRAPDLALARDLLQAGGGHVRVMTLAPELPGADALVELLVEHDVVAAVGHTEASAATTARTLAGQPHGLVTHLFNGMPPLHHRGPGPVGGALAAAAHGDARVELIADGVHLADETVSLVFSLLGADRVVLVTDAMAAAGMPDGDYSLGPQDVTVRDGVARLHGDGEQLSIAGGTARLVEVLRRVVQRAGVGLADAVACASTVPATVLGLADEVGALRPGLRADVLVVDDDLRPLRVMKAGAWV